MLRQNKIFPVSNNNPTPPWRTDELGYIPTPPPPKPPKPNPPSSPPKK